MIHSFIEQKNQLNQNIKQLLRDEIVDVKLSAEEMVECATNLSGQGYSCFMLARENFLEKIDKLQEDVNKGFI